jgi:alpha-1,3-rhamnosyltransferase
VLKNNTNPLVSIIIPCYNYEQYIEKCIQSAIGQTYENIEVIVVDNGSTDNSLEKIKLFSDNEKVKIIELKINIPPGTEGKSSVGIAINESIGEYISILYADDWYLPKKIEKQIHLFEKVDSSVSLVYCHGYRFFENNKKSIRWKMQSVRGYVFKEYLSKGDVVIPISPLVKRHCYDIIGLNNIWTGSEYDFFIMSQYVNFDYVDDYLVVMREHDNNDAKSTLSVYKRVKKYHYIMMQDSNARLKAGWLIRKRVAMDMLSYGLEFISSFDVKNGREAILESIKTYPLYIFRPKAVLSIGLSLLPIIFLRFLLKSLKK